jgi:hypothetical protein
MKHALNTNTFDAPIAMCSEVWNPPASVLRLRTDKVAPGSDAVHVLREHEADDRTTVEQFIAACFVQRYGARIERFMPRLFTLRSADGSIRGAVGLRAASQRLFLEQYLDETVETAIATRTGVAIERASIVEVGHFCGAFPGAARKIIALLAPRLHDEGFTWVVFTGTVGLRNAFTRIGMRPLPLRGAQQDRLPDDERATWGTYYEHAPRVLCGRIEDGLRALRSVAPAKTAERTAG